MYNFNSNEKIANVQPEDIAKLLRSMGATGNFRGFDYIVSIIYQKLQRPNQQYWTTKMAYPETTVHFNVTPGSVERSIRTTIGSIWDKYDHSDIDRVAGRHLEDIPTNSEFLDIVAAYLSYGAYPRDDSYFRY